MVADLERGAVDRRHGVEAAAGGLELVEHASARARHALELLGRRLEIDRDLARRA